jgi:hypothetical protein
MHADDTDEPPGAVSNQVPEEAEAGHSEGDGATRRPPGPGSQERGPDEGAASEGSQATGHPENAG